MKTFRAEFTGRKLGAIGIFYPIVATVTSENEDDASLRLYEHYEHIQNLKLIPVHVPTTAEKIVLGLHG